MIGDVNMPGTAISVTPYKIARAEKGHPVHGVLPLSRQSFSPLPSPLTPFIGREQICAALRMKLEQPDVRLVTLTGIGGIGKTRLGIEVGSLLQDHYRSGICFVPLVTVTEPYMVLERIAQSLNIQMQGDDELLEQLKAFLKTKNLFLFLDNFEHVIEARVYIEELLLCCPEIKILVTSRVVLHIDGEHEFCVPPLSVPDLEHDGEEPFEHYEAVKLFIERVRAIKQDFQVSDANRRTISEICVRLDGLPLAIELAAARTKLFPLPALLHRLSQRLHILSNSANIGHSRHHTLQNTLKWSYDLLTLQEQSLFCLLSVFNRESPFEGIQFLVTREKFTSLEEVNLYDILASLIDKSFVTQIEQEEEEPRFHMLETVQLYGRERLQEAGWMEEAKQLHALYYLNLLEQAQKFLYGKQQLQWLKRIKRELENIRAALAWALEMDEISLLERFCASLSHFWLLCGDRHEGRHWVHLTIEKARTLEKNALYIQLLCYAGELAYYQDEYQDALSWLHSCIELSQVLGCKREQAHALSIIGMVKYIQGLYQEAQSFFTQSEQICRALDTSWEHAFLLRLQGLVTWYQGDLSTATNYTQEGLVLARKLGERSISAKLLSTLSGIATRQNDFKRAEMLSHEIVTLAHELDDTALLATTLQNLGYVAGRRKDFAQARTMVEQALECFRKLGDKMFLSIVLHSLGYILMKQKEYNEATSAFEEGLQLALNIGNDIRIGWHLIGLAEIAATQHRYPRAARLLAAANRRFDVHVHMNKDEIAEYTLLLQTVQTALGSHAFQSLWNEEEPANVLDILVISDPVLQESPGSKNAAQPPKDKPAHSKINLPEDLTSREYEVLQLVAQGLTDIQIAEQLVVSPRTVNSHLSHVYKKLQVTSRSAATRFYFENLV